MKYPFDKKYYNNVAGLYDEGDYDHEELHEYIVNSLGKANFEALMDRADIEDRKDMYIAGKTDIEFYYSLYAIIANLTDAEKEEYLYARNKEARELANWWEDNELSDEIITIRREEKRQEKQEEQEYIRQKEEDEIRKKKLNIVILEQELIDLTREISKRKKRLADRGEIEESTKEIDNLFK